MVEVDQQGIGMVDKEGVKEYLLGLQDRICASLVAEDGGNFREDDWERPGGGGGRSRALAGGVIEKAGVNFSHVMGSELPAAASARRPELAGRGFEAMGVSVIVHPRNPFAPTAHANVRFFIAEKEGEEAVWWFGGGFDLTPYYGFEEDAVHWHQTAQEACRPFGDELYGKFKKWCDEYFFLKHRDEPRGVGGLFFDDFNEGGFAHCFAFMRSVGESFVTAYMPILQRRKGLEYGDRQREFQLYRRGRYVEFNLVYDRGTVFGLRTAGRIESILMSLPLTARWEYCHDPVEGSDEAKLLDVLREPRDWV